MSNAKSRVIPLSGACLTVIYLCLISSVGRLIHNDFAFFPELAALGYGMFMRPNGPWARAPLMAVLTPTATALWGVSVASHLPYGIPAAMLCIVGSILIVKVLKSPVFPAVPAGFLPLVFGVTSAHYIGFIAFDTGLLALFSIAYRRWWHAAIDAPAAPVIANGTVHGTARGATSTQANGYRQTTRWVAFSIALSIAYFLANRTNIRLMLFPPLIVIAYETLVRAETCPWAQRIVTLPLICVTTAAFGWISIALFGIGPLSVLFALSASIVLIRVAGLFILPALAISVIPQIMVDADWHYPLAVGTGTLVVTAVRLALNAVELARSRSTRSSAIE